MRYSVLRDDPGYKNWAEVRARGRRLDVWLNGVRMDDCVTVDTEKGWGLFRVRNREGNLVVENGEIKTAELRGIFVVEEKSWDQEVQIL